MPLFQVDPLGSMFLFCSHGVNPPFQAALDPDPGEFGVLHRPGRQRCDGGLAVLGALLAGTNRVVAGRLFGEGRGVRLPASLVVQSVGLPFGPQGPSEAPTRTAMPRGAAFLLTRRVPQIERFEPNMA